MITVNCLKNQPWVNIVAMVVLNISLGSDHIKIKTNLHFAKERS